MSNIDKLSEALNYTFQNKRLLSLALSHRSIAANNNERLEFLGDSILNFIITERLYQKLPKSKEGELSRMRANLVNGETLASLAQDFKLGGYLKLGAGEIKSGGAKRASILADSVEALIGAIYLDSDMETCRKHILAWYSKRLQAIDSSKSFKDAKTRLQEYLQGRGMKLPIYSVLETKGKDHDQVFYVECFVENLDHRVKGKAKSRRKAEQQAAEQFLKWIKNE